MLLLWSLLPFSWILSRFYSLVLWHSHYGLSKILYHVGDLIFPVFWFFGVCVYGDVFLSFKCCCALVFIVSIVRVFFEWIWFSSWSSSSTPTPSFISRIGPTTTSFHWMVLKWWGIPYWEWLRVCWIDYVWWYSKLLKTLLKGGGWFLFVVECYRFSFTSVSTANRYYGFGFTFVVNSLRYLLSRGFFGG